MSLPLGVVISVELPHFRNRLTDTAGAVIGFKTGADRIDFGGQPLHFGAYPKMIESDDFCITNRARIWQLI
jgi:hypothetical protein